MSYTPPVGAATSTTRGIVKLTGDFAGTADSPTVPGLATLPVICRWNDTTNTWVTLSGGPVPTTPSLVRWYDSSNFATSSVTTPTHYNALDKWYRKPEVL
jgi:hypothetical protein